VKIATWNVNSIKARLPIVLQWLRDFQPDVLLVQEIKTTRESFPYLEMEDLGYNIAVHGQKSYNGVAIFSKFPLEDILYGIPGEPEETQARYIEAVTHGVRVMSVYVPHGREIRSPYFQYKLDFLQHLKNHVEHQLSFEEKLVLGGDFNVTPSIHDVHGGAQETGKLHCSIPERLALKSLTNMGLIDAVRERHPIGTKSGSALYSWWDYRSGGWQQNKGMRIDMLYLSPQAADCLGEAGIDIQPRSLPKASDHAPVWCELLP